MYSIYMYFSAFSLHVSLFIVFCVFYNFSAVYPVWQLLSKHLLLIYFRSVLLSQRYRIVELESALHNAVLTGRYTTNVGRWAQQSRRTLAGQSRQTQAWCWARSVLAWNSQYFISAIITRMSVNVRCGRMLIFYQIQDSFILYLKCPDPDFCQIILSCVCTSPHKLQKLKKKQKQICSWFGIQLWEPEACFKSYPIQCQTRTVWAESDVSS